MSKKRDTCPVNFPWGPEMDVVVAYHYDDNYARISFLATADHLPSLTHGKKIEAWEWNPRYEIWQKLRDWGGGHWYLDPVPKEILNEYHERTGLDRFKCWDEDKKSRKERQKMYLDMKNDSPSYIQWIK